jgi:hypothetical protein
MIVSGTTVASGTPSATGTSSVSVTTPEGIIVKASLSVVFFAFSKGRMLFIEVSENIIRYYPITQKSNASVDYWAFFSGTSNSWRNQMFLFDKTLSINRYF